MAFEQKRMDEADKALYASWGIRNPLTAAMTHAGEWTVDTENNIYLVSFGGRGEMPENNDYPPDYFFLRYKELNVFFEGREKSEVIIEDVRWKRVWSLNMDIPHLLENDINHIVQTITNALLCQLLTWRDDLAGKIEVHVVMNNIVLKS